MGCTQTKTVGKVGNTPQSWIDLFATMCLTKKEVTKLYDLFCKVDIEGSGSVDIVELLILLDIERTAYAEQVFTVFESDSSGKKVDFTEFVLAIWNYCTIRPASLDIFTFNMYDRDKSGKLSLEAVRQMLLDLFGRNHINDPKVKSVERELEKFGDKTSVITVEAFKKFAKENENLLYPVFKLQRHLQDNVLGVSFWTRASERRVQLCGAEYVSLANLMLLHMDKKLIGRVLNDAKILNHKAVSAPTASNNHSADYSEDPRAGSNKSGEDILEGVRRSGTSSPTKRKYSGDYNKERHGSITSCATYSTTSSTPASYSFSQNSQSTHSQQSQLVSPRTQGAVRQAEAQTLSHGFGSSFMSSSSGSEHNKQSVVVSKKDHANGHHHGHGHHSVLKSTAAAADGTDVYFDSSVKVKPVHATGHHQSDVNVVLKRRSVTPAN